MIWLWDALVFVLFVFPFVLGGIWIHRPGLKIELAELGVPILILALVAAALRAGLGLRVSRSQSARWLESLARSFREAMFARPYRTLLAGTLLVGTLSGLAALRRHWSFGSHAFDLGLFTNAIWNFTQGTGYLSSVKNDLPLLADHQSPLFLVLAPLFALFPRPETLLLAQSFGLASGAIALYFLGRQYSPRGWGPLVLPLAYWLYLPVRSANLFDFHPEVFQLPLFLFAIAGIGSLGRAARVGGAICLLLALGAKESAGPVAAGIGLAWVLGAGPLTTRSWTRRIGWLVGAIGVSVFWFDVAVVPKLFGAQYAYASSYAHLDGVAAIARALFSPERIKFLIACLLPLAFLPLLGGAALVAALPGFLMLFLSEGTHRVSMQYHYGIEPAVGLLWAFACALPRLEARARYPKAWRAVLAICLLATFGRSDTHLIRFHAPDAQQAWLRQKLLPRLDPELDFAANESLVPHLATRRWVSMFPIIDRPTTAFVKGGSSRPVDCALFDSRLGLWPMTAEDIGKLPERFADWKLVYQCGTVRLWQNPSLPPERSCLQVDVDDCVILKEG